MSLTTRFSLGWALGIIGALQIAACAGVDTGNGGPAIIEMALKVGDAPPVDQGGAAFTVGSATARVRHIELYLPTGAACVPGLPVGVLCDGEKLRVDGPFIVDLLTGSSVPPVPTFPVPIGTYRRVDIRLEKDELTEVTLAATGTMEVNGQPRPWRMGLEFDDDIRFEGVAIEAVSDALARAVLELDMTQWFSLLPLSTCAAEDKLPVEDGVIVLGDGDDSCVDVESVVEAAIRGSGALFDDDNDAGDD